jgi:hypothetical protein
MLSLHLTINGKEQEAYWPFDETVQLEYSGPEGINLYFSESDAIRGARIEFSAELVEAMYWLYMRHNAPLPDKKIEFVPEPTPF